jgi:Xaa-Pro dipeptidase
MAALGTSFDSPKFTKEEYASRLKKVRTNMRETGIDVLVVFSARNFYYLTGYQSQATYYQALIITPGEMVPFLRYMENIIARTTMTVGSESMVLWEDHLDPTTTLADLFRQRGWHDQRIGIEKNAPNFTVGEYESLVAAIGKPLLDGSKCINNVRVIKSPQEIAYMRKAATLTSIGLQAAMESLADGQSENEVAGALQHAIYTAGGEGTKPPTVSSGPMSGVSHSMHYRYILRRGDPVLFEFSGCWLAYPAPLIRSACILEASDQVKKMADTCVAAVEAAIDKIRPGAISGEVDEACRKVIEDAGFEEMFRKRTGYGIGIFKPGWSEGELIDIKRDDPRELQEGMTFHLVPALRDPGKCGVGCSETVAVSAHGCEVITTFPRKLYITSR